MKYRVKITTELGKHETLNLTAISIDDAKELAMKLVSERMLGLNGRTCVTIEVMKAEG